MSLEVPREQVVEANPELVRKGLVLSTFGNASGIDRELGLIVIKPSGIPYEQLKPEHPGLLVANHGPFAWDSRGVQAAENAWMLEVIARTAYFTLHINPAAGALGKALHDYYLRKHGKDAYHGQAREKA
jgi:ribulose-5-phosphate 4-epimerase/fuculose-1-phosphate aldolase